MRTHLEGVGPPALCSSSSLGVGAIPSGSTVLRKRQLGGVLGLLEELLVGVVQEAQLAEREAQLIGAILRQGGGRAARDAGR